MVQKTMKIKIYQIACIIIAIILLIGIISAIEIKYKKLTNQDRDYRIKLIKYTGIDNIQIKESDKLYFKQQLRLTRELDKEAIKKLIRAKQINKKRIERILKFARLVEHDRREHLSGELLDIDESFIERLEKFYNKNYKNKAIVKKQIKNYARRLKQSDKSAESNLKLIASDKIKSRIANEDIKSFFKNKNAGKLIKTLMTNKA
jgi:ribosomal protein L44E